MLRSVQLIERIPGICSHNSNEVLTHTVPQLMSFLPIVERELRISSRRAGTYRLRWILVVAVLLIWFLLLANTHWASSAQRGKMLFIAVGVLAFVFALF